MEEWRAKIKEMDPILAFILFIIVSRRRYGGNY